MFRKNDLTEEYLKDAVRDAESLLDGCNRYTITNEIIDELRDTVENLASDVVTLAKERGLNVIPSKDTFAPRWRALMMKQDGRKKSRKLLNIFNASPVPEIIGLEPLEDSDGYNDVIRRIWSLPEKWRIFHDRIFHMVLDGKFAMAMSMLDDFEGSMLASEIRTARRHVWEYGLEHQS